MDITKLKNNILWSIYILFVLFGFLTFFFIYFPFDFLSLIFILILLILMVILMILANYQVTQEAINLPLMVYALVGFFLILPAVIAGLYDPLKLPMSHDFASGLLNISQLLMSIWPFFFGFGALWLLKPNRWKICVAILTITIVIRYGILFVFLLGG